MWTAESNNNVWNIKEAEEVTESIECLIEKRAEAQIRALCKEYEDLEWLAGLIGYEDEKGIKITEIKLFEQEVSGAYVELTNEGSQEMARTKTIGWIHSHNKMGVFFSSTDVRTSSFNQVSLVVNNKFEIVGRTIMKTLWGKQIFIPLKIYIEDQEEVKDPIIEEAKKYIKKKESTTTIIRFNERKESKRWNLEEIEEIDEVYKQGRKIMCAVCEQPISPKKLIIEDRIPYHDTCLETIEEEQYRICNICGELRSTCNCEEQMRLWDEASRYNYK